PARRGAASSSRATSSTPAGPAAPSRPPASDKAWHPSPGASTRSPTTPSSSPATGPTPPSPTPSANMPSSPRESIRPASVAMSFGKHNPIRGTTCLLASPLAVEPTPSARPEEPGADERCVTASRRNERGTDPRFGYSSYYLPSSPTSDF